MAKPNLTYYHQELSFLRQMGKAFAQKYPKIARRLNFMDQEGSDPHLERLIESFAFLTSYLQKEIADQMPRFSSALLNILYPHLVSPIPPMSIAQFRPSTSKPMTESAIIPQHFPLYSGSSTNDTCYFRTGYKTEIWPIEVSNIEMIHADSVDFSLSSHTYLLKISLKALKTPLNKLNIKSLRFYINGSPIEQSILHKLLFEKEYEIAIQSKEGQPPIILPKGSVSSVGFDTDENLIPCMSVAHPGYGLLQEYFAFPRKFMFCDIKNLDFSQATDQAFMYIPIMNTANAKTITFSRDSLMLGCTPIINLFPRTSEPLRFDHKKIEYRLVPDYRREMTTEIHSIQKVFMSSLNKNDVEEIQPYFSYTHKATVENDTSFWSARRAPTVNLDIPGTDIWLSFVNWNLTPDLPPSEVVYASLLCTNRQLASLITANTLMKSHDPLPIESIVCLHTPTDTFYPPEDGQTQWQLISSLSINHISTDSGDGGLTALKEILRLFNFPGNASPHLEVDCLRAIETKPIVRRLGTDVWRGFTKGMGVTITVDEEDPHGGMNAFLFSEVLSYFFGMYVDINCFAELTVKSIHQEGVYKVWPARSGTQPLL